MAAREAELLPVPYFHVVFTLPAALGAIAYQNKAKLYGLLFTAAVETLTTIAGDPKHLGADIGVTAVLHTWGQNFQHHPHLHCIVPGGGLSPDGERWIARQNGFFLPVRVLSRLFRHLFLQGLEAMHAADELQFFADLGKLKRAKAWRAYLAPLRKSEWIVYAKKPFAGPLQVLAYLARYTHRVAISNSRLLDLDATQVSFRWKDYRENGRHRSKVMRLDAGEFIRRFLLHVLPTGFHRIRHYGLFANGHRADKLELCRRALRGFRLKQPSCPSGVNNCVRRPRPLHPSKRSKNRTQYQDSNKCDDATDDHRHHHVEIAFTVSQTADLQQQQHRAIVREGVQGPGAHRCYTMHQVGIDAMLDGETHKVGAKCIEYDCHAAGSSTGQPRQHIHGESQ